MRKALRRVHSTNESSMLNKLNITMKNNYVFKELKFLKELFSSIYNEDYHGIARQIARYYNRVDLWATSRGKRGAVLHAKNVYHATLNAMLGQPDPEYSFLATHKGWPIVTRGFRKYTNTSEGRRMVLTILSIHRILIVPGSPDFESITRPGVPVEPSLIQRISEQAKPVGDMLGHPEYQLRSKSGPNGQAVRTATSDAVALREDPQLNEVLLSFLSLQGEEGDNVSEDLHLAQEILEEIPNAVHSKLSLKQEPGGKVRVFAICDYYSQIALKPLHNVVAKLLRSMSQDFTWNQEAFSKTVERWKAKGLQSFESIDLSSATDRFPAILQKEVVGKLVGKRFSELWYDLMTNRDFTFRKQKVRYAVGQPMGAYSSWPVFAYTHHLVVRYCASTLGIRRPEYAIVGDDIVIPGKRLAKKYREVLDQLGVPISKTKSLSGNCIEFCKRIWDDTQEITPIPLKLILKSRSDYRNIIQLLEWLHTRGVPIGLRDTLLTSLLPSNEDKRRSVVIALTAPWKRWRFDGAPIREDWRWPPLPLETYQRLHRKSRIEFLMKQYNALLTRSAEWCTFCMKEVEGVPGVPSGYPEWGILPHERAVRTLGPLIKKTLDFLDKFMKNPISIQNDTIPVSHTFDPQVLQPDFQKWKLSEMSIFSRLFKLASELFEDQPKDQSQGSNPVFDPAQALADSLREAELADQPGSSLDLTPKVPVIEILDDEDAEDKAGVSFRVLFEDFQKKDPE